VPHYAAILVKPVTCHEQQELVRWHQAHSFDSLQEDLCVLQAGCLRVQLAMQQRWTASIYSYDSFNAEAFLQSVMHIVSAARKD
jgi:hypothetical protein